MIPTICGSEVVKHVPHRLLISQWARCSPLASRGVMGFDFEPVRLDFARAMVTRVVHHGDDTRYLVLHYGSRLTGCAVADARAKYLDDILTDETRDCTLTLFDLCRRSRQPVYAVADGRDGDHHVAHFERLLLPFSDEDNEVTCIISTVLISRDESSERAEPLSDRSELVSPGAIYSIAIDRDTAGRAKTH
jgi:hypothetical protein